MVAVHVTEGLIFDVREAITTLFKEHESEVLSACRHAEEATVDQEEACGYLLADAMGRPLLAQKDARKVGKRAIRRLQFLRDEGRKKYAMTGERHVAWRAELRFRPVDFSFPPFTVGRKKPSSSSGVGQFVQAVGTEWLQCASGDIFAGYSLMVNGSDTVGGACKACGRRSVQMDWRASRLVTNAGVLPPLLVIEAPDKQAKRTFGMPNLPCLMDDGVRELAVQDLDGNMLHGRYRLLAVGLYDGSHYVAEMRDVSAASNAWVRVDGNDNRGCATALRAPCQWDSAWEPIVVVYQRVDGEMGIDV